jgi:hypothetical protein
LIGEPVGHDARHANDHDDRPKGDNADLKHTEFEQHPLERSRRVRSRFAATLLPTAQKG